MEDFQFRHSSLQLSALHSYNGEVYLPGSKSITNRVLLISALAEGNTRLHNLLKSDDTRYMGDALCKLGGDIVFTDDFSKAYVVGSGAPINIAPQVQDLFLGNAGTAMRSLCAALTLGEGSVLLHGEERMKERPIRDLVDALRSIGADISYEESEGYPPVRIHAHGLKGGEVSVRGNISSQYLTALLICAPYCETPLHIHVDGELISAPYILLTLDVMRRFGIDVKHDGLTDFYVPKGVYRSPGDYYVEGDASSASYPLAAAAIAKGKVRVLGVGRDSIQGDVGFTDVLRKMGAKVELGPDWIECDGSGCELHGMELDLNDIPDAAMTVAVLALFAKGATNIRGIASWRVKETDRIAAIAAELRKVGAEVRETSDSILITPPQQLVGATIETYNDHRMAMCFSLVALGGVPIKIMDPACVNKTYPSYFDDFLRLAK
ncbi:3-phosphoshikimate 1-carboxyvinyltransferase [uncultured Fibrobacter sp.]|uniref:3-phosphoshikimate 1-carboxyvinyltransferase n=1 Tax=uncultured Fibrobacter sp. TaxID=261512 RepID=UPI002600CA42|nr:3-phosphoshikimate 1-carboxyvinyltransferase [uncultured Fibrobacter sp.]